MHDVFISYSSKDLAIVETICRILEGNRIKCWMAPRDIPVGSNYAKEIPAAIRGCNIFLLVMSEDAQSSIWVSRELDQAVNYRKLVIPVMLEDFPLNDVFGFYLTGYQRYNAYEKSAEALQMLVHKIKLLQEVMPDYMPALRYEGYYVTQPTEDSQRMYYRFYPNGKVVSCSSSGDPVAVSKWLNESYSGQTSYRLSGTDVEFNMPVWGGHEIRYRGSVREDALKLIGYSTFAKKHIEYDCSFVSLEEIDREANTPKAEIIDIRTINPKLPARLEETALRFDGLYFTAPQRGFRSYYRFYPDGAMVCSYSSASPAQAATWLNMDKYEGGRVMLDGETIRMEEPLSNNKRYFAELTLRDNGLTMKGLNTYSQKEVIKECSFLSFAEING